MPLRSSCKARVQQRSVNPCPTTRGRPPNVVHSTRHCSGDSWVDNVLGSTFSVAAGNLQAYLSSPTLRGNFRAMQKTTKQLANECKLECRVWQIPRHLYTTNVRGSKRTNPRVGTDPLLDADCCLQPSKAHIVYRPREAEEDRDKLCIGASRDLFCLWRSLSGLTSVRAVHAD